MNNALKQVMTHHFHLQRRAMSPVVPAAALSSAMLPAAMLPLILIVAGALLAGCASTAPGFDEQFGKSVRATVAAQVADPAAVRNANPAAGIDGDAASAAHASYVKSFAAPAPAPERLMNSGK